MGLPPVMTIHPVATTRILQSIIHGNPDIPFVELFMENSADNH
jgi:hypothetical protein